MTKIVRIQASPNSRVVEVPLNVETGAVTLMPGRHSYAELTLLLRRLIEEDALSGDDMDRLRDELQ